jgi:hypothetical protein
MCGFVLLPCLWQVVLSTSFSERLNQVMVMFASIMGYGCTQLGGAVSFCPTVEVGLCEVL